MWLPLTLLVLAGTVAADYDHGFKGGNEYVYLVRSRTFASLNELSHQYTGVLMKAKLTIQAQDPNRLTALLSNCQYARVHDSLPEGWNSQLSDQKLELRDLPVSGKPFEIKLKHGVVRDIVVDRAVRTWELNLLKAIVSQIQVDTQGENAIQSNGMQRPQGNEPYGSFRAMEDTVGGKCEVLYDITPLPEEVLYAQPELVPLPHLKENGEFIEITKTKNYDRCDQRMTYHFGISEETNWEPGSNDNGAFLKKSATSRVVISGDLKRFVIQSSVTTNKMHASPRLFDQRNGLVVSTMNLTLASVRKISNPLPTPSNPESTGNLVYQYNNPYSDSENRRGGNKRRPGDTSSAEPLSDSISSVSSSEEATRNGKNLRSMSSSSSSSSSSSISSSEENDFWQPKPNMEDAPQTPLLPVFIGYRGNYMGSSENFDIVKSSEKLIYEIANELEDPSNIPTQQTLEKFVILCSLIRAMDRGQIAQVDRTMHLSPNELRSAGKPQTDKQNAWAVYRDAVTQAGTGPALLIIKSWVEKREIGNLEAADILSRLPKTARTPTASYLKAFFEMASNPNVKQESILNATAIISFADLIRQSQVNTGSIHNRYPVHTYGRMVSKKDQTLQEEYIPYMARELKNAFEERNSKKIQTYIMALGTVAHPKILSVLEPYLEGREKATPFQRTLMVAALGDLTESYPKLARSVLYKIYLNTMECHEVRCTAVFLLMKTNPPLSMLQRMAEFANYDTNKHVNSAVKSTLMGLAKLNNPEHQDLARKCQTAAALLPEGDYGYQYSHGYYLDTLDKKKNTMSQIIANYIGSDDSSIPQAIYFSLLSAYGNFKTPPTELMAMISSVRSLYELIFDEVNPDQSRSAAEKIAEQLNIVPDKAVPFEANVMWKSKFLSRFIPIDRHSLRDIPNLIVKHILSAKDGRYMNTNRLMSYDVTVAFPMENGLPFVYTMRVPILQKITGSGQMQINRGLEMNMKFDVQAVYSQKVQGRIGFVTPFDHHYHIAGVDMNFQAYAPIKLTMEASMPKGTLGLKIWAQKGQDNAKLLHYSVAPYTSAHNIFNLQPLASDKNTQVVNVDNTLKASYLGSIVKIDVEADKSDVQFWTLEFDNMKDFTSPYTMDSDKYRKVDVYLNAQRNQDEPLQLTMVYDTASGMQLAERWLPRAQAMEPSDKGAEGSARRKQYLQEVAKGIKSAKAQVLDVLLEMPSQLKGQSLATVAWASSDVENKARAQLYLKLNMPGLEDRLEICAAGQANVSPNNLPMFDEVSSFKPNVEFDAEMKYGRSCAQGEKLNVQARALQSSEYQENARKSPEAKICEKQMKHGNKILTACRNAAMRAIMPDMLEVSAEMHSKSAQRIVSKALGAIANSNMVDSRLELGNPRNAGKQKIDVKAKLSPNLRTAGLSIHTPDMDMHVDNVPLEELGISPRELYAGSKIEQIEPASCIMDKTRAETFDGKEFPLRLGNCWHVVMTTYRKADPVNHHQRIPIPKDRSVSILAKETENGEKEVKLLLGDDEILLLPTSAEPNVIVNGRNMKVSSESTYQGRENAEVVYEIYKLPSQAVAVTSKKYDLELTYDGKRLQLQAADKYRNSVRGLCGNFDGDKLNEFMGPKNCLLWKPEYFSASYALTKEQCEGPAMENARSLQSYDCRSHGLNRYSNVYDEDEHNQRRSGSRGDWGYHRRGQTGEKQCSTHRTQIYETEDKICFTIRPVFACARGCFATEEKSKKFQFHCMERNEAAMNLKKRIEKGANPDLSQKPVSMSRAINVPLACKA